MICLVSRQTLPNIIPVLQLKPDKVVLLTTTEEKKSATILTSFFKSRYYDYEIIEGVDAFNVDLLEEKVETLLSKYSKDSITLNITGGTKLMALAAFGVCQRANIEILYCNTIEGNILYLSPNRKSIPLRDVLSIQDFLESYGFSIVKKNTIEITALKESFFNFIRLNSSLDLHGIFKKIRIGTSSPIDNNIFITHDNFTFTKKGDHFLFQSTTPPLNFYHKNISFFQGFWFEEFLYWYVTSFLKIKAISGVEVKSKEGILNEIDLMFSTGRSLGLISAKSGNYSKDDIIEIEKLSNLAGGTYARAFFFSLDPITEANQKRAKQLNVTLLTLQNLNVLTG